MLLVLLGGLAIAASCPEPTDTQSLVTALNAADAAFAGMSLEDFEASRQEALSLLPCLREPLTAADAAHLHRVQAYGAFLAQNPDASRDSMVSLLRVQPGATLPSAVAPEGHPLYTLFEEARAIEPDLTPLTPAQDATLLVDGQRGEPLPSTQPAVLQLVADTGEVRWTVLLQPGDALPEWEPRRPEAVVVTPPGDPQPGPPISTLPAPQAPERPWALVGGAAAGAVAAGALYAGSAQLRARFDAQGDDTPAEDMISTAKATNGLIVASGLTGGVALGLGAVAVVRW